MRAFEDEDVTHTEADVNPVRDMEIICSELVLKDLEYTVNRISKLKEQTTKKPNKRWIFLLKLKICSTRISGSEVENGLVNK